MTAKVAAWEPDVLPGYWQRTIPLGPDPDGEGDIVATVIRRGEPAADAEHAVLAVHGYTDYFFHTEMADHFAARGSPSMRWTCINAAAPVGTARRPHFTTDLASL